MQHLNFKTNNMKTAMQIAIESYKNDGVSFTDWFIDNYEMLLEKEKKQIINAYSIGFLVSKDLDMAEASSFITNDYYNQAHNEINNL